MRFPLSVENRLDDPPDDEYPDTVSRDRSGDIPTFLTQIMLLRRKKTQLFIGRIVFSLWLPIGHTHSLRQTRGFEKNGRINLCNSRFVLVRQLDRCRSVLGSFDYGHDRFSFSDAIECGSLHLRHPLSPALLLTFNNAGRQAKHQVEDHIQLEPTGDGLVEYH
jgi:hypothetical protein